MFSIVLDAFRGVKKLKMSCMSIYCPCNKCLFMKKGFAMSSESFFSLYFI
jgi:hypothetical protein